MFNNTIFYFILKKNKKCLLNTNIKNKEDYLSEKKTIKLIFLRFFLKKKIKNKKKNKKKSLMFNFFKTYLRVFLYFFKNKKMYKYNSKIKKYVFRPNFNLLKNRTTKIKFKKKTKKKNKKKKFFFHYKFFFFFLFNYSLLHSSANYYKKNKIFIFQNVFYFLLKTINYFFFKKLVGGINFFVLTLNVILFSFIFWFLTFACKYFYQDKYSNYKLNFYECGFKSISAIRLDISVQYFLIAIFLIIYDSEFILLFPVVFNMFSINNIEFFFFFFFVYFIFLTLFIDYIYSTLEWNI